MTKHRKKNNIPLPKPQTLRLKDNHTWKAPPGHKIVVADRGAVSFNIPANWVMAKMDPLELRDKEPPDENARLTMSFWRTPPGIDWTDLPLESLLLQSTQDSTLEITERSDVHTVPRDDLEMVWVQNKFVDPVEKRDAYTRILMARGFDVHMLITFDLWVDDVPKFKAMWDELVRSIQLGRTIEDPTKGVITQ